MGRAALQRNARARSTRTFRAAIRPTVIEQVILLGLDDTSLVGAPTVRRSWPASLRDLRQPDAVIVDNVRLRNSTPTKIGAS